MIESENPSHEVYIDGFQLLGEFIPYNTGVDSENTINTISGELTTGKDYTKYLNEKSKPLAFETLLTDKMAEDGYEEVLKSVVAKAKKEPVKILFDNESFMGKVKEFSVSFPTENYRKYTWLIIEDGSFKPETKKFNSFNYKKATTATKDTVPAISFPPTIELLLNCNPVYNCNKRNVKCVTAWQTRMSSDGFYKANGYVIDGLFCTYTEQETKKWQKHYGIKQTGVVDKATKTVLVERFGSVTGLAPSKSTPGKIGQAGVTTSKVAMSASDKKKALQSYAKLFL